jgi:hypothetical protein
MNGRLRMSRPWSARRHHHRGAQDDIAIPIKLIDAQFHPIFIVEGESAGGSARQRRIASSMPPDEVARGYSRLHQDHRRCTWCLYRRLKVWNTNQVGRSGWRHLESRKVLRTTGMNESARLRR